MSELLALVANLQVSGVNVIDLLQAVLGFIGAASVLGVLIAKMTKTTKDDAFFAKVRDLVLKLSLNQTLKK